MKRFISLMVAVLCTAALAACGSSNSGNTGSTTQAQGQTQPQSTITEVPEDNGTPSGYTFTYKGATLYIGENASVIDQLGEYKDYAESASCAYEAMDKQYFYGSFYVTTGTIKGQEFIASFWFVDDTVETDEGLCIGDSKDKVEELYGADGFNGTNAYIYNKDMCQLLILIENDTVSAISYTDNR